MKRILLYLTGLLLSIVGCFFCIININLLTIGYSFKKYVNFIISNIECSVLFVGFLIIVLVYERG